MASMFAYDSMSRDSARRNPLASSVRAGYLGFFFKSGLAKKEEGMRGGGEIRREKRGVLEKAEEESNFG